MTDWLIDERGPYRIEWRRSDGDWKALSRPVGGLPRGRDTALLHCASVWPKCAFRVVVPVKTFVSV